MTRLTDHDQNFGPFTLARWTRRFAIMLSSGDEEEGAAVNTLTLNGFGWALRIRLPSILQPWRIRHEAHWDTETVARLGRNHYFETHEREFGLALSDMGNGYDFLQVHFGPQTHDSSTTKDWCAHLPWKQWRHVRHSLYTPEGHLFAHATFCGIRDEDVNSDACRAAYFGFEDFDGELIVATCKIEEREWHRGEGWFRWMKWFCPAKIRRSLDLQFSSEVGPEKGSWKGGTMGHGIEMLPSETPRDAFERYCGKEHDARHGRKFRIRFIGPCEAPAPKQPEVTLSADTAQTAQTNPAFAAALGSMVDAAQKAAREGKLKP